MVAKRFLAALIVLILTASAFASDAKRVYFGARAGAGIGMSRWAGEDKDKEGFNKLESDEKWWNGGSFDVAPFVSLQLADAFALQTEFLFTSFGFGTKEKYEGDWYGYNGSRGAMVIPLLAKLTLADRKVGIFAGPHLMPGIGDNKITVMEKGNKKSTSEKADTDYMKTQLMGLTIGADFGFDVGPGRLFLDARYLTSLGKPRKGDKWDEDLMGKWDDANKTYLRLAKLSFTVGYELGAGSR